MQWGTRSAISRADGHSEKVTLPVEFTTNTYSVVITPTKFDSPAQTNDSTLQAVKFTTTSFNIWSEWYSNRTETIGYKWIAIGI